MQIGDRVSIKRKVLNFHDQGPAIQDSFVLATVTSVHAPSSFTVKYDQPQDGYGYREIPFQAIPETVQIVPNPARDTQFAGFAELLSNELRGWELSSPDVKKIIARRAYDLVQHVVNEAPITEYEFYVRDVSDMTAWPEVKSE